MAIFVAYRPGEGREEVKILTPFDPLKETVRYNMIVEVKEDDPIIHIGSGMGYGNSGVAGYRRIKTNNVPELRESAEKLKRILSGELEEDIVDVVGKIYSETAALLGKKH